MLRSPFEALFILHTAVGEVAACRSFWARTAAAQTVQTSNKGFACGRALLPYFY